MNKYLNYNSHPCCCITVVLSCAERFRLTVPFSTECLKHPLIMTNEPFFVCLFAVCLFLCDLYV